MSLAAVRDAYSARSTEYVDTLGSIEETAEHDRNYVLAWATQVDGLILDAGCGPGQWTSFLHGHGLMVEGIDPVPEFVEHARSRYPDVTYRVGSAGNLDVDDESLGGVLAWYSLIHTAPGDLDRLLADIARCLRPGGQLAVAFFAGLELEPFEHAVTAAYYWPVDLLAARVERAGLVVVDTETRHDPGSRPHGAMIARKPDPCDPGCSRAVSGGGVSARGESHTSKAYAKLC